MTNFYKEMKKDIIKDLIGLILIGLCFVGFCIGMIYILK